MTSTVITPATSLDQPFILSGSDVTLTVLPDAYIASAFLGVGITIGPVQNFNDQFALLVGGSVYGAGGGGIVLTGDVSRLASITIESTGHLGGAGAAALRSFVPVSLLNLGEITGGVDLFLAPSSTVVNFGTISANVGALAIGMSGTLTNSGTVIGDIRMNGQFANFGVLQGSIQFGGGNDTYFGMDAFGHSGVVDGIIHLSGGADVFHGGAAAERVDGGAGNDTIILGHGDDVFFASNQSTFNPIVPPSPHGNDRVDGGLGTDTYDASALKAGVTIDLARGDTAGSLSGTDTIFGFEDVIGTGFADVIVGSAAANRIATGAGADRLTGGHGADDLSGGAGADHFVYSALADSTVTPAGRDLITDFEPLVDRIDLRAIDANQKVGGDQAFTFIGSQPFHGRAGELHEVDSGAGKVVQGDVNGDGQADFAIALAHVPGLVAADFLL